MRAITPMLERLPNSATAAAEQTVLERLWREAKQRVATNRVFRPPVAIATAEPTVNRVRFNRD